MMDPLAYLGKSMPAAVPGAPMGGGGPTMGPLPGAIGAMAPQGLPPGAVPGAPSPFLPPGAPPPGPGDMQYATVTQSDGTILLHVKNPDGSLGPVIQVLKAPKLPGVMGGGGMPGGGAPVVR